jgi:CheY-like chemotaxis protein
MDQYADAEPYLRQAIEIEPSWYNAYKNLGVSLAARGEYAEAAKLFVLATVLSPYDPRALYHLEELLDEHELVYLQVPEIRADLEKCRKLVKRNDPGPNGVQRISPPATAEVTGSSSDPAQEKRKAIAILDDEPVLLEVLGNELADEGFEVLTCTDKSVFIKELSKLSVDVVISDIASPGMNGIQLLVTMKRHPTWRHIPVIIVSGNVGAEAVGAKIRGAYEVFEKPYSFEELLVAINCALADR